MEGNRVYPFLFCSQSLTITGCKPDTPWVNARHLKQGLQVSRSDYCVGRAQVDRVRGFLEVIFMQGSSDVGMLQNHAGGCSNAHQHLRTADLVYWSPSVVEETEAWGVWMMVTAEGHSRFKGVNFIPIPLVPQIGLSIWPQATPIQGVEGGSLVNPWRCWEGAQAASPLHPFCILQQSSHQADDLRGWLDRVILRK